MEALLRFYHVPCTVLDTTPIVSHLFFMRTLKVLVPILQVKKLRLRGVRQLAETHPPRRNWSQDSSVELYASRFFLFLLSCSIEYGKKEYSGSLSPHLPPSLCCVFSVLTSSGPASSVSVSVHSFQWQTGGQVLFCFKICFWIPSIGQ